MKDLFEKIKQWFIKLFKHDLTLPFLFLILTIIFMPISVLIGGAAFGVAVNYLVLYILKIYKK